MKILLPIITSVCLVSTFVAGGNEQGTTKCLVKQPANTESQLLQGTWEGVQVGEKTKITITITGDSLHFFRDKSFWFKTTIALPAGKAVYKIEDGTLTLATIGEDAEGTAESFETAGARYELKKVKPQKKNIEPPKNRVSSDRLERNQLLPKE